MGIYDRDYTHDSYGRSSEGYVRMGTGFRGLGPVVKWTMIINFGLFILTLSPTLGKIIYLWGTVYPETFPKMVQLWRLVSYQFLHWGAFHFLFNMIVLFFFGPILEYLWGSRTFLKFYLLCGAAGGLVYTLLVLCRVLPAGPMAGASGAVYGVLAAVAVLYPKMRVLVWGIIPMRLMWVVILTVIISLLSFLSGKNAGGEAAHLTGLAAGAAYVLYKPWLDKWNLQKRKGSWEKKRRQEQVFQAEVDRILEKVNREGIASLSDREKQMLQEATRREQMDRF